MQNGEYTAFWYLWGVSYLKQLQFTIGQNILWTFLCFLELPFVLMEQSPDNTCQAIASLEWYFYPLKINVLSTHEI